MTIKIFKQLSIAFFPLLIPLFAFAASSSPDPQQLKELCDEFISDNKNNMRESNKEAAPEGLSAADYLDALYKPLVPKGKLFLEEEFYYFGQYNYGNHGSNSYQKVLADSHFSSLKNYMAFSPFKNFELAVGYRQVLPTKYDRSTYGPQSNNVILKDTNSLQYLQEYSLDSRVRLDCMELYMGVIEIRQRSKFDEINFNTNSHYLNKIRTHYEDFKIGARFIQEPAQDIEESNLSKLTRPLLAKGQINTEIEVSSQKAAQARKWDYDNDPTLKGGYINRRLGQYYVPSFYFRYGLSWNIETDFGIQYKTPYKFKHKYHIDYLNGNYSDREAAYKFTNTFCMPAKIYWRPEENLELSFSSDFSYGQQRLDYYVRNTNGSITSYPAKKFSYINTVPTLNLSYLYENETEIKKDTFAGITETLLSKGQALLEFEFKKDITHLDKNATNTTQNIFDPRSIFFYPLDNFVSGTEYAAHYSENSTFYSNSVPQQNCFYLKGYLDYGLSDRLNLGIGLGYRSESYVHSFSVSSFDNTYFKLYPYYFLDTSINWQTTQNSMLVFKSHFVPIYKIRSHIYNASYPGDFETESHYIEASLAWKALF